MHPVHANARAILEGAEQARRLGQAPAPNGPLSVLLEGLRLVSENNAHEHWRERQKRAKRQRWYAAFKLRDVSAYLPCRVRITRIAPRELDDDNLHGACKHVRDGVADALGLKSDRDPRVSWEVAQERGGKGVYAVRVEVIPL